MKKYIAVEKREREYYEVYNRNGEKVWPPGLAATEGVEEGSSNTRFFLKCKTRIGEILVNLGGNLIYGF